MLVVINGALIKRIGALSQLARWLTFPFRFRLLA